MTDPKAEGAPRPARPSSQSAKAEGPGNTSDMSEDESADLSPQDHGSPSESIKSSSAHGLHKSESEDPSALHDDDAAETPNLPLQKRRRVTRACDECRRKKIKCDGKQPCTHCSVYSYECTYDKPSNRRRNPAPQYIEALEARLQRAEGLLRKFMPDVDLSDKSLDPAIQHEFQKREQARSSQPPKHEREAAPKPAEGQDAHIMSMIESIGQLDINEGGEWDFHGISSGAVFLHRMKEHFRGLLGADYRTPFLYRATRPEGMFSLDSPRSGTAGPWDVTSTPDIYDLPPQQKVRSLCYFALNCATCLLRVVHQPTFYASVDKLYRTPQSDWGPHEHRFLGLLYSVMALGCMYNTEDNPSSPPVTHKSAAEEGTKYYVLARLILQDVAECRDMTSLQGLVYMILFLQATSNISGCYAFLGIALRSCLRMGLHRHLPHAKMTPIEDETRRRVFHVVKQLDTYVSAMLGFPILLQDEDADQPVPTEVDDEYITEKAILQPPPGTPSFFQAFAAHSRLMTILAKVVKHIYPLKGVEECVMNGERPNATYLISYARIKEIERELHEWYEQLPTHWRPSSEGPIEVVRVRTLLRFIYAHVQMILYRPFLHYISARLTAGKKIDDRYYNCAAAGISVSRNIVHIGVEIQKQAVLIGPYWFILYTEFFAILSLVFYVLENPDKPGTPEILADAHTGRDVIAALAQRSVTADRITTTLQPLFEQLQERLKKGTGRPMPTKKRSAPGPGSKTGNMPLPTRPGIKDNLPLRRSEELPRSPSGAGRIEALPGAHPASFDSMRMQPNSLLGQTFGRNLDMMPVDMTLAGSNSDTSSSTHGNVHRHTPGPQQQGAGRGAPGNPLYKLDAMMFPSADPFAYPNQPLLDPAGYHPNRQASHPAGQDQAQFFMPAGVYDDIEGQLLGPIPPYLVPQASGHQPMDPLYSSAGMVPMQQSDHGAHPHQRQHHHQQQQQQQQQQQHQRNRQHQQQMRQHHQQDMMDDMLVDPTFQNDNWDDILGGAAYR